MEELLSKMAGRKVDVVCSSGSNIRGEILKVDRGVLYLKDEEQLCYVAVDKISVVWEANDSQPRAGFVPGSLK
jgi:hypothetical protein